MVVDTEQSAMRLVRLAMAPLAVEGQRVGTALPADEDSPSMATKATWVLTAVFQIVRTNRRAAVARVAQDCLA